VEAPHLRDREQEAEGQRRGRQRLRAPDALRPNPISGK
jgi:hypothetical protein